jgi:hypothetical protein
LACDRPAFCEKRPGKLIAAQPAAQPLVDELVRVGVFCERGERIAASYEAMCTASDVRYSEEQRNAVATFMDRFVTRSARWPDAWNEWVESRLRASSETG